MPTQESTGRSVDVAGDVHTRFDEILTPDALDFLAVLHREFEPRRQTLLGARHERHAAIAAGADLAFLDDTRDAREGDWQVAPPAPGLVDRRVEITGPTDAKMAINALNSGAKVWLADLEDANTPLWENLVQGQLNLRDAVAGTLAFTNPDGKEYRLGDDFATIVVRPRGWHLSEKHLLVDGERMSGSLVDFGLYFFHCARPQLDRGSGPYFYLPKMESHLEARLWNDVFVRAQDVLGLPSGTIRATVLIETVPAAFEMEEILHELREHSAGLNAGRWDYMFSMIKLFRDRGDEFVLPDRSTVTMTVPFMRAYTELLVRTCHKRGAHAIGGMAAFIPSKDEAINEQAFAKVRDDKAREAADGFDGSWVAHPGMVSLCAEVFTDVLGSNPDQRHRTRDDVEVTAAQLLDLSGLPGEVTEQGLRTNVRVGISYLEAWLRGIGAVGIDNLMEDAATAEISRSQVWQWLHHGTTLADGRPVTRDLVDDIVEDEYQKLVGDADSDRRWAEARALFTQMALAETYEDFLTIPAYEQMP
ncbi:malate synthase A [Nocardioides sp.]|uniref:malate synthase A n=1 Tax=Nocardioides sp. TaxID=35761 RepID=UPI002ED377B2